MSVTGQTDDAGAPVGSLVSFTVELLEGDKFVCMVELHPDVGEAQMQAIMQTVVPQLLAAARRNEQEAQAQEDDHAGA